MAHAEICPVCNGSGKQFGYVHRTPTTDNPVEWVFQVMGLCHGCGGLGWVNVTDVVDCDENEYISSGTTFCEVKPS